MSERSLRWLTSPAFGDLAASGKLVVLVPVGSVEPHGPHLSLETDTEISLGAAELAAARLEEQGLTARIAPPVPYGVTECARAFPGAVSVPAAALSAYLGAVVDGFLASGAAHVCLINNHLEPEHDSAVRAAVQGRDAARVSVACPLTRRWARTLSDEFKSGACHAGRYETSLALARDPRLCDEAARAQLPEVPVSLSDKLRAGVSDFAAMGLARAYAGAPAEATRAEGDELFQRLADMVVGEVLGALGVPRSSP
ncbi:MAG TPA: creatininase family protein [Kofleriaceae bacterium]|nr:creatininase family protein [Kofleriaceae bacterium]